MQYQNLPTAIGIAITADIPIFIWGVRGSGKTQSVASAARAMNRRMITKRAVTMDALDGPGLPYVNENKRTDYALPQWLPTQPDTVVFFDEFPQAPQITMNSLSEFILEGTVNGEDNYKAPPRTGIVCAGNMRADKCGTTELPNHMKNRFCHVYPEVDPEHWAAGNMNGFPDPVINILTPTDEDRIKARGLVSAFIRHRPNLLSVFGVHEMATNESASGRTWDFTQRLLPYLFHVPELQLPMVQGCVGEGPAGEFIGFMRTATRMPNPVICLAQPREAPIPDPNAPDAPAITYALCAALASRVTKATANNYFIYIDRLPADFAITACTDIWRMHPTFAECKEGVAFMTKNAKYMIATRA